MLINVKCQHNVYNHDKAFSVALIYKDMLCFRIFNGLFFMLISVKMQTHVGILTFIIMINFDLRLL